MDKSGEQRRRIDDGGGRRRNSALAELHRALKVMGFYPAGHPLRAESLRLAFGALRDAVGSDPLMLSIGKGGFASSDGAAFSEQTPMMLSLARELFIRRVRRLAFLPGISPSDMEAFLALLSLDHRSIPSAGGMETLMAKRGITTIWVNEIDLTAIDRKRQEIEASLAAATAMPVAGDQPEDQSPPSFAAGMDTDSELTPPPPGENGAEQVVASLEELVALMAREPDDERYRELARDFVKESGRLQAVGEFERLIPPLELLLQQAKDERVGLARCGSALLALDQAVGEGMVDFLVRRVEAQGAMEGVRLLPLFAELGFRTAAPLVKRLCCAEAGRPLKNLAAALVAVGEEVGPLVAPLLDDERGHVVQAAAEILGEVGYGGCVAQLRRCLGHPEEGVRREALRSLVRISGPESEEAVIDCLASSRDQILRRLAAVSLGTIKGERAVEALLAVAAKRDSFLRTLPLKRDALAALGRIGDRRAVPVIAGLLGSRHWLSPRRGEELRCLAAAALGQIGDPSVMPLLSELAAKGGRVGLACVAAAGAIEQRQKGVSHG